MNVPHRVFRFLSGLALIAALSVPAHADDALTGQWLGTLTPPGAELRLLVTVTSAGDESFTATMESLDQAPGQMIPISAITMTTTEMTFEVAALGASYHGIWNGESRSYVGEFNQGINLPLSFARPEATELAGPVRPQEPVAPFPYREEDVRFDNPAANDVSLAGTLTLPAGEGPFPTAILISGSGPQDRDETVWTHRPFAVLADHLTRQGIAVLRYDDRGYGESTGDFASGTSMDFATDAEAALAWLETRPEIDASAIGLIGHSEGGLIAPIIAARNSSVAFIVLLAGPGTTGQQVLLDQSIAAARMEGRSEADLAQLQNLITRIMDANRTAPDAASARSALQALLTPDALAQLGATPEQKTILVDQNVRAWTRAFLNFDPAPHLAGVEQPVLALNGSLDIQVLPEPNLAGLRTALAGNADATILELEGLNHMFQTAGTGSVAEYGQIEETFNPDALELVSDWITERFAP